MGNWQHKKLGKIQKNQIQTAALRAKIHLQLTRDRKGQQIIKGQKQLVAKLSHKQRNKSEEVLLIQRIINGLKYSQAANQLIFYALTLRNNAAFLAQNIGNTTKLQPLLQQIHTLLFAADKLGLFTLNQFKQVMKALNDPLKADQYINPQIKQMLSPTPTKYQMNIYILEMTQRNNIQLQQINSVGHKFLRQPNPNQYYIINQQIGNEKKDFKKSTDPNKNEFEDGQGSQGINLPFPNYYNVPNPPPITTYKYTPYKVTRNIQNQLTFSDYKSPNPPYPSISQMLRNFDNK